jgi:hypothetical protein
LPKGPVAQVGLELPAAEVPIYAPVPELRIDLQKGECAYLSILTFLQVCSFKLRQGHFGEVLECHSRLPHILFDSLPRTILSFLVAVRMNESKKTKDYRPSYWRGG